MLSLAVYVDKISLYNIKKEINITEEIHKLKLENYEERNKNVNEKSLEELKNIGLKVLELDEDRNKHTERKAEILLGFLGLIIPAIIILFFNTQKLISPVYNFTFNISFIIIVFLLITTVVFSLSVLITRIFKQIDLKKIYEVEFKSKKISRVSKIKEKLVEHFYKIHNHNKKLIDNKAKLLKVSFILTFISLFLIAVFYSFLLFKI